jgi:hypothetical protein
MAGKNIHSVLGETVMPRFRKKVLDVPSAKPPWLEGFHQLFILVVDGPTRTLMDET